MLVFSFHFWTPFSMIVLDKVFGMDWEICFLFRLKNYFICISLRGKTFMSIVPLNIWPPKGVKLSCPNRGDIGGAVQVVPCL